MYLFQPRILGFMYAFRCTRDKTSRLPFCCHYSVLIYCMMGKMSISGKSRKSAELVCVHSVMNGISFMLKFGQ